MPFISMPLQQPLQGLQRLRLPQPLTKKEHDSRKPIMLVQNQTISSHSQKHSIVLENSLRKRAIMKSCLVCSIYRAHWKSIRIDFITGIGMNEIYSGVR